MSFFSKEYFSFFKELRKNNNKQWFDANRDRYEQHVKTPFKAFTQHILNQLAKKDDLIFTNAAKCIFRINKDISFSKDKSPYKHNMAAVFGRGGTQDLRPGFYLHIGDQEIMIGGGMYNPSKEDLGKIRQEMLYCNDDFSKLIKTKKFVNNFGGILGDKNKVLDADYKEFQKVQPLIANKQFYYMANLNQSQVLANDFDKIVLGYFESGMPFNDFLYQAISSEE